VFSGSQNLSYGRNGVTLNSPMFVSVEIVDVLSEFLLVDTVEITVSYTYTIHLFCHYCLLQVFSRLISKKIYTAIRMELLTY
jgi:hypothetical protein